MTTVAALLEHPPSPLALGVARALELPLADEIAVFDREEAEAHFGAEPSGGRMVGVEIALRTAPGLPPARWRAYRVIEPNLPEDAEEGIGYVIGTEFREALDRERWTPEAPSSPYSVFGQSMG